MLKLKKLLKFIIYIKKKLKWCFNKHMRLLNSKYLPQAKNSPTCISHWLKCSPENCGEKGGKKKWITCKQSIAAVAVEQWTSLSQSSYEVEPSQIFGICLHSCGWPSALSSTPSAVLPSQPEDSVIEDKDEEHLSLNFKHFVALFCLCMPRGENCIAQFSLVCRQVDCKYLKITQSGLKGCTKWNQTASYLQQRHRVRLTK